MTVGEYCNREVIITGPESTITEAAKLMRQHHVGTLVVVEREGKTNRPIGIITDRDLVIEVLAQEVEVDSVTVGDVISRDLVQAGEGETLPNIIELMQRHGVRRILVVDDKGSLQGLMSADDVIELLAETTGNITEEMDALSKIISREIFNEQETRP